MSNLVHTPQTKYCDEISGWKCIQPSSFHMGVFITI